VMATFSSVAQKAAFVAQEAMKRLCNIF